MAYTTKRTTNRDLNKPTPNGEGQRLNKSNLKYSDKLKTRVKKSSPRKRK